MNSILYFPVGQYAKILRVDDETLKRVFETKGEPELPFPDNVLLLRTHDESKPFNRILLDGLRPVAVVHGECVLLGVFDGEPTGLTDRQIAKYLLTNKNPTGIIKIGNNISVFPYKPIISKEGNKNEEQGAPSEQN